MNEVKIMPRITELIDWAEHSENWNQGVWAKGSDPWEVAGEADYPVAYVPGVTCNTSFCLAGQAVNDAGWAMLAEGGGAMAFNCAPIISRDPVNRTVTVDHDRTESISIKAAEILGINWAEREALFASDNTIEDIKRIANRIALNHGEAMPYPGSGIDKRDLAV